MDATSASIAAIADDPKAIFLASMARALHRSGIATDSLEQTLTEIARAIGLDLQIFALPTQITLAIGPSLNQQLVLMRLDPGQVNLRNIALLNLVYDDLRSGRIDYRTAASRVTSIDGRPTISIFWQIPALALMAIAVAIILGAGMRELTVAGFIGLFTGIVAVVADRNAIVARLFEVIAAFGGALIVAGFAHVFGPTNIYVSIVAGVVVLLPGYSLTLALHELANNNLVAGVARLGNVLSVLLALACGALLGFAVIGPSLLRTGDVHTHAVEGRWWIAASLLMAIGLSIDLHSRLRDFVWVFASCFIALLISHEVALTAAHTVSAFASAFLVGVVANAASRFLRLPHAVMLVPALLILVPGSLSYESVLFAFQQNISSALTFASNAAFAAIELVAGLLLAQLVFPSAVLTDRR